MLDKYQKYKNKYLKLKSESIYNFIILDITTQKFVDTISVATPIYKLTPNDARQVLNNIQKNSSGNYEDLTESFNIVVPLKSSPNEKVSVEIVWPVLWHS